MVVKTLDKIIRSTLAARGYPMHWYLQFLVYGIDIVRELEFDIMQNVKSVRIPINSYKAGNLPDDYVDWVRVGEEVGQYITPILVKTSSLNRMNKFDDYGQKIPYGDVEAENGVLPNNWEGFWYTNYVNDKGEHMGRIFNNRPAYRLSCEIFRERGEIQMDVAYTSDEVVMDYVSDGTSTDSTSNIHPYAEETIKAYIVWKYKSDNRKYPRGEVAEAKDEFYNELRKLSGRLIGLTAEDIIKSLRSFSSPVIKG